MSESLAALHKVPQPIQLDSNPGLWSENGFFPTTTLSPWPDSPEDSEGLEGRGRPSSALEPKSGPSPSPGGVGVGGCASAPPQLHRDSLLGPRGNTALSCGQTRPAACPASSSPPPHLLTETRLLLFLTLQLPLAWGSPLHPPAPPAPTGCHRPVILRAVPQPARPWAQRMPVQVCGASKTTRLQPCRPSRRIPPPRLFPNLRLPACPASPCHPGSGGGRNGTSRAGGGRWGETPGARAGLMGVGGS